MTDERPYIVTTSDRTSFKRCRRRWDLGSRNRQSLVPIDGVVAGPLWQGTGHHFALEDWYGYRYYDRAADAFRAYADSHRRSELPEDWKEITEQEVGMLNYFQDLWLPQHGEPLQTLWIDGVPQVEATIQIPLDIEPPPGYTSVLYVITLDRVAVDEYDRLVVVDYKTEKKAYEPGRMEQDPQCSAYLWGARLVYGDRLEGAMWHHFLKAVPDPPEVLKNGELSMNKAQYTTASMYRETCMEYYGTVPSKYLDIINHFAAQETPEGDRFINRQTIYRNETFMENTERAIFAEVQDMIDPHLSLYPNQTRDCTWDCQFRAISLAMDDGSDYEYMKQTEFERWEGEGYKSNQWRKRLKYPEPLGGYRIEAAY